MKNVRIINSELVHKIMTLEEIDFYMEHSGYNSIFPADIENINKSGLIWYPFEPFLNQINIWVTRKSNNKYYIEKVELFSDEQKSFS